jgi:uncharacterized protein (DUF1778 family)
MDRTTERISISVDPEILELIKAEARKDNRSVSNYVIHAVLCHLNLEKK